jgi:5-methylcytosine-specific restriction endonuclease McrA
MVFKKGHTPWTSGKEHTKETKDKISKSRKGIPAWNKGINTGMIPRTAFKAGMVPWNKGLTPSKEIIQKRVNSRKLKGSYTPTEQHRKRISAILKGKNMREKNGRWMGGISFEPYGLDWRKDLRESIRKRDNYHCQICKNFGKHVHHIDYVKRNCNPQNLITLCNRCHARTNTKRNFWQVILSIENRNREVKNEKD